MAFWLHNMKLQHNIEDAIFLREQTSARMSKTTEWEIPWEKQHEANAI